LESHQVLAQGEPVKLSATEFRLLEYLYQHAGRVRTYSQILENVWGAEYRSSIEYVHIYAHKLRQKLERDAKNPTYLLTEHGIGYRFAT
jgi:two-component system KDP operon response regulator KdpE